MKKIISFLAAGVLSSPLMAYEFKPVVGGKLSYFLWQGNNQGELSGGEEANKAASKLAKRGTNTYLPAGFSHSRFHAGIQLGDGAQHNHQFTLGYEWSDRQVYSWHSEVNKNGWKAKAVIVSERTLGATETTTYRDRYVSVENTMMRLTLGEKYHLLGSYADFREDQTKRFKGRTNLVFEDTASRGGRTFAEERFPAFTAAYVGMEGLTAEVLYSVGQSSANETKGLFGGGHFSDGTAGKATSAGANENTFGLNVDYKMPDLVEVFLSAGMGSAKGDKEIVAEMDGYERSVNTYYLGLLFPLGAARPFVNFGMTDVKQKANASASKQKTGEGFTAFDVGLDFKVEALDFDTTLSYSSYKSDPENKDSQVSVSYLELGLGKQMGQARLGAGMSTVIGADKLSKNFKKMRMGLKLEYNI